MSLTEKDSNALESSRYESRLHDSVVYYGRSFV